MNIRKLTHKLVSKLSTLKMAHVAMKLSPESFLSEALVGTGEMAQELRASTALPD